MPDHHVTKVKQWDDIAPVHGIKPHTVAVTRDLQERSELLFSFRAGEIDFEIKRGREALWILARFPSGGGVAIRGVYAPDGDLELKGIRENGNVTEFTVFGTTMGEFKCRLELLESERAQIRWTVTLTPLVDLLMPPQPWNVYPINAEGDPIPTHGIIHAQQRGSAAGLLFFSLTEPESGTALYVQNLTALNEYCEITCTTPNTIVGAEWPGMGFQPPPSDRHSLPSGREVGVCDFFLRLIPKLPRSDRDVGRMFLDMLADIYAHFPRPETSYHDWPDRAEETLRDLIHSKKLTTERNGYLYLHPYTDSEYPDSMVQLTVLLPIREYADWKGMEIPFTDRLREGVSGFFDPKLKTMRRYLSTVGEDKNPLEVDSWYLYHPLANLARLAKAGDEGARDMFLQSVEYGIRAAHRFEYWWPIKFNIETFKIITGDRKPGEAGQTDVPGLYAYVMLEALDLTGDERYLKEAQQAIRALNGLSFDIGYQYNNTAWGATACLRLWKITGEEYYREQSFVFLASFFHNVYLWECDFGPAKHYPTFMGVTCLHDGNYMAMYEEFESFTAFHECLHVAGEDLPPSVRILLTEYCKYVLHHGWYYYPGELPREALATEIRNGHIDRSLAIPLEDLYADWQPAGAVGQEVYGCGGAFAFVTRSYHRIEGAPFLLYCEYPVRELEQEADRCVAFRVDGESGFQCRLRLIPTDGHALPDAAVRVKQRNREERLEATSTPEGHREYLVTGGSSVVVDWREGA
ncbi:MAG: hypothetical protein KY468_09060 [Armatimonadetes bacterium]|nr:hypothetical protein [Armatimonadota bacterium]